MKPDTTEMQISVRLAGVQLVFMRMRLGPELHCAKSLWGEAPGGSAGPNVPLPPFPRPACPPPLPLPMFAPSPWQMYPLPLLTITSTEDKSNILGSYERSLKTL